MEVVLVTGLADWSLIYPFCKCLADLRMEGDEEEDVIPPSYFQEMDRMIHELASGPPLAKY